MNKTPVIHEEGSHTPLQAGDTLPGSAIQISADTGNIINLGTDGGLHATAGTTDSIYPISAIADTSGVTLTMNQVVPVGVTQQFSVHASLYLFDGSTGETLPDYWYIANDKLMGDQPNVIVWHSLIQQKDPDYTWDGTTSYGLHIIIGESDQLTMAYYPEAPIDTATPIPAGTQGIIRIHVNGLPGRAVQEFILNVAF